MIHPRTAAPAAALAAALGAIRRALEAYAAARGRRVAMRQLERMSDRALRDIGLERGQIRAAVYAEPL